MPTSHYQSALNECSVLLSTSIHPVMFNIRAAGSTCGTFSATLPVSQGFLTVAARVSIIPEGREAGVKILGK